MILFALPSWANSPDGKSIYCISDKEWLRDVHLVGEKMFMFKEGKTAEIWVTEEDPPKPVSSPWLPYKLTIDIIRFGNYTLFRKSLKLLTPTGVSMTCEVYNDGMISLSKKIDIIIAKYNERLNKNKL